MKASDIFGIVIRTVGVGLWIAAAWQAYKFFYVLMGNTSWVHSTRHAFYDHLFPAACLVAGGMALIRGSAWLARYAYPKSELQARHAS